MLSKKMIRDIKNHKSQFLSIFLMAFLGVFVFAGIGGEYTGFEQSVNDYYDATNLADGWIYSSHLDNSTVDKVDNLSATTASERQLVINSVGDFDNDPDVTLHFVENNDISKFYLVEGKDVDIDDDAFKGIESIIHSMTPTERTEPRIIDASRKKRIAKGSGTTIQEVNQLLKQFTQMSKMMKMMQGGGGRQMMQMMKGMGK